MSGCTWPGAFDADKGEISLYLNGVLAAQTPFEAPWQPAGVLTVGRSQAHGTPADFWAGSDHGGAHRPRGVVRGARSSRSWSSPVRRGRRPS